MPGEPEELLAVLRGMDAAEQGLPVELVSAQAIAGLLDVSSRQVVNWLAQAREPKVVLPQGNSPHYTWGALRHLVPPLRIAESSPVQTVRHEWLPGGEAVDREGDRHAYGRFLQLLLSAPADRAAVPLDWEDPVHPEVLGWLGDMAVRSLQIVLRGRRPLVIAEGAPVLSMVPTEEPKAVPAKRGTPGLRPNDVWKPSAAMPGKHWVPAEPEVDGRERAEDGRRSVAITKIFDRTLTPQDLLRLGVGEERVDEALRAVRGDRTEPLTEVVGGTDVYRGANLHKVLIALFGLHVEDAEAYLGVRPGLVERYVGQASGFKKGQLRSPELWDEVLQEFRPDLMPLTPLLHLKPREYGFKDKAQLLAFVCEYGGVYVERDEGLLLSHTGQELLQRQLERSRLPSAEEDDFAGWCNARELAEANARPLDEAVSWALGLPATVGHLGPQRRTWLQSRRAPHIALPHYSPAVGKLFGHVARQRAGEDMMVHRRRLYRG